MGMKNLLEETFQALDDARRRPNEVFWVGTKEWTCTFVEFTRFAKVINYDGGYGLENIATDLVIVGEDWWLERGTYDGMEWWRYRTLPERRGTEKLERFGQLLEYDPMDVMCESNKPDPDDFDRYVAGDR